MNFLDELMAEASSIDLTTVPTEQASALLRDACQKLYDSTQELKALEAQVSAKKKDINQLESRTIPDIMMSIGQDKIGLPDAGEHGVDIELKPYHHANIANDWDDERRAAAFNVLERNGDGDLIRNVITMSFTKGENEKVKAFLSSIDDVRFEELMREKATEAGALINHFELPPADIKMTVPWNTLTSYVKEQDTKGTLFREWMTQAEPPVDPVEALGATIGHVAKIKPRKGK